MGATKVLPVLQWPHMLPLTLLLTLGAGAPTPQLAVRPEGFSLLTACNGGTPLLRDRSVARQWCATRVGGDEPVGLLTVAEYPGPTAAAEAEASRAQKAEFFKHATFGDAERTTIDGQPAILWQESDGPQHARYVAVVSYAKTTYTVELSVNDPKVSAAALRNVVTSLRMASDGALKPGHLLVALLAVGIGIVVVRRFMNRMRKMAD